MQLVVKKILTFGTYSLIPLDHSITMSNPTAPCVVSTLSRRWGVQQCKCDLVMQGLMMSVPMI